MRKSLFSTICLFEEKAFFEKLPLKSELFDNFIDIDRDFDSKLGNIDIFINVSQIKNNKHFITRRFIDMKRSSLLISLGNHMNIDLLALIEALIQGKITGAWLDFNENHPFTHKNPLFSTKNLMISCENLDSSGLRLERLSEDLLTNLGFFNKGLINEIRGKIDPFSLRFLS